MFGLDNFFRRIINIALRMATLGAKFSLVFVLAKFLGEAEFGLYGLFSAAIGYMVMALGFDFYTYATRELINKKANEWAEVFRDQFVFYLCAYVFVLPICILVFVFGLLPWQVLIWFFVLLVIEHFSQEVNRILVAISRPLQASVVLFVRHGLWAVVVAVVMWFLPDLRSLDFVFGAWVFGGLGALLLAVVFSRDIDRGGFKSPINWGWIKIGFVVSVPFVISTLSLKAIYTADRYWIEHFNSVEVLAAYVLFAGLANSIISFLDASVFSFVYPGVVSAAGKKDGNLFVKKFKEMAVQASVVTIALAVLVVGFSDVLIRWIGKLSYFNNIEILYWVVAATVVFALSTIPHYGLYSLKEDRAIVFSHVFSMFVFIVSLFLLQSHVGLVTVPVSMLIAFVFLFLIKSALFYRVFRLKKIDFFWG